MEILIKIDRFLAWVLFIGFLLYFVSGYGMTKGFIDPQLASQLHLNYLTYIIAFAFVGHSAFAIHLAFKRWQMWNSVSASILFLFYILLIGGLIYIDRFYVKPVVKEPTTSNPVNTPSKEIEDDEIILPTKTLNNYTPEVNPQSSLKKTFTLTELAQYNGKNGQPAYTAVDGDVYDLTQAFPNGNHYSHLAGTELTNAFYSTHAKSKLAKYPIVGTLVK